jgi:Lon protease-like protein
MAEVIERFRLFPLGLVLLPGEVVPLHIFEERYKVMIGECLDGEEEFGILWMSEEGLKDVGCAAAVAELLERMEDGRLNILVRGSEPFRVLRRRQDMTYPAGDVEPLEDTEEDADEELTELARERYADLVERATDRRPDADSVSDLDAFAMAATIDFRPADKQELLELRSEPERLRALTTLFETTMKRLDYAEKASRRARSNGRIRF